MQILKKCIWFESVILEYKYSIILNNFILPSKTILNSVVVFQIFIRIEIDCLLIEICSIMVVTMPLSSIYFILWYKRIISFFHTPKVALGAKLLWFFKGLYLIYVIRSRMYLRPVHCTISLCFYLLGSIGQKYLGFVRYSLALL